MNNTVNSTTTKKLSTRKLVLIALMTAITCIFAPMAIPIPVSPVPISLTNLVIMISIYVLGFKDATISYIVYLLLGLVGLPVFSGFTGGLGKLAGPTGGYLIGFIFLALISGLFVDKFPKNRILAVAGMIVIISSGYLLSHEFLNKHDLRIGSKDATESVIIGNMLSDLIEAKTDLKVERKLALGGTMIAFEALRSGEIDLYPEYTGTGYSTILKNKLRPGFTPDEM